MEKKLATVIFLILLVSSARPDPTCVIQGICGSNENGIVPCAVSKEPHKFEDSSDILGVLKDECPELFPKDGSGIPDVCCSPVDVITMQETMIKVANQMGTCPPCAKNIKELLCHFHCAPNQAAFVEVTKTSASANGSAIESMNYHVNKQSLDDLFQTCSKLPMVKPFVHMAGCEKDCETAAEFARVIGMRKIASPFDMIVNQVKKGDSVTVNGKPGSPAEFLIQKCAEVNACSDTC